MSKTSSSQFWTTGGSRPTSKPARRSRFRLPAALSSRRARRRLLVLAASVLVLVAGAFWHASSSRYIATGDAMVAADLHLVTPEVGGRISEVQVQENEAVRIGDILFRIDPEPYRLALEMADAKVVGIRAELAAKREDLDRLRRELQEAERRLGFFEAQAERQEDLERQGAPDPMGMDMMVTEVAAAQQRASDLQAEIRALRTEVGNPNQALARDPRVREAEAERDLAALKLAATELRAPGSGIVTAVDLQPGAWIDPGEAALGVLDPGSLWIEAELGQRQSEHVQVGQRVRIAADAFPGESWHGQVASISPATNTVVRAMAGQAVDPDDAPRLPVRITLDGAKTLPMLRAGLSVRVWIDTEHETWFARRVEPVLTEVGDDVLEQLAALVR